MKGTAGYSGSGVRAATLWPTIRAGWLRSALIAAVSLALLLAYTLDRDGTSDLGSALASRDVRAFEPTIAADKAAARAAIEKANATWLQAFRSGNFDDLAALYTDDASLSVSGSDPVEGRGNIVGYLKSRRERGLGEPTLKTLDVVTMGDVAYETGTYRFKAAANGGLVAGGEVGKYFVVWKASHDGTWRYNLGIWTSSSAASLLR